MRERLTGDRGIRQQRLQNLMGAKQQALQNYSGARQQSFGEIMPDRALQRSH